MRLLPIAILLSWSLCAVVGDEPTEFFEKRIRPVLHDQCFKCHGPEKQKASLRLDSRAALLKGGDTGPAIIPQRPEQSLLLRAIAQTESELKMPPPKVAPQLPENILADFRQWVLQGAPFPEGTNGQSPKQHWAFAPLASVTPPRHASHPIDEFLGTENSPAADPRTLLRRISYDLTGLPPTADEVAQFSTSLESSIDSDRRKAAVNEWVDRLLTSPAYGEKWGRKWLDLARYADTAGENTDRPLHQAWRYRNYVIDAFNHDIPYDQFLREQIAGDILAASAPEHYSELISATGYLAIARRFGHEIDNDMHLTYEDVIDTVGKSVLGLSIGCARCHNHKYDPITTHDYYGLYGIFSSTKFAYPGCEPNQSTRDMVSLWSSNTLSRVRKPFAEQLATIDAVLTDLDTARTNLICSISQSLTNSTYLLAQGDFPDGGKAVVAAANAPISIQINRGELIRCSISPKGDHGADTTLVELTITEKGGAHRRWDLTTDVIDSFLESNPHSDSFNGVGTWCFVDAREPLRILNEARPNHDGKKGLHVWRAGDTPSAFVNATTNSIKAWTTLTARSLFLHPAKDGPVAVLWLSPFTGTITITGRLVDAHSGSGDGIAWRLERIAMDASQALPELARLQKRRSIPAKQREQLLATEPKPPVAYAVSESTPADARVQKRGDPEQLGEIVPRKNLDLFGGERLTTPNTSGRLDLARWLTATNNPLTARVMVNRIWQGHFGRGIVSTPSDFGTRGAAPSHPELLDWLAAEFINRGWSVKAMHRLMISSAAYQSASTDFEQNLSHSAKPISPNSPNLQPDHDSRTFSYSRRRLEAEEIRDSLLLVSGDLDHTPGTSHPFPPETANFTQHTPFKAVYESKKRSIYLMVQRIQRHPFLALFDGPDSNVSTAERGNSTVPTQALFFLNDPFFHARSRDLAQRLLCQPEPDRISFAHLICFQRKPSALEQNEATSFLRSYQNELEQLPPVQQEIELWSAYARTLLASNEFLYVD